MDQTGKAFAGCVTTFVCIPPAIALNGYALSVLWGWFIVPVFHLPAMGVAAGCGMALVAGMLVSRDGAVDKDQPWWLPSLKMFIRPVLSLGFGAIYRLWL